MTTEKIIEVSGLDDFEDVEVVEVLVSVNDEIKKDQSIITMESDKATMEFPSPDAGIVKELKISVGDKVNQGDALIVLQLANDESAKKEVAPKEQVQPGAELEKENKKTDTKKEKQKTGNSGLSDEYDSAYASPSVRKYASDLEVDLEQVKGTGNKGRILKEDVQFFVKNNLGTTDDKTSRAKSIGIPDFSEYGEIEEVALNKLRQVSAERLSFSWQIAPHVTQFDEADITELENARKQLKDQLIKNDIKLTLLPFVIKALIMCLREFPDFNSSLNEEVTALIYKKYFHIGIAVDTPKGLVVPVLRDADKKKIPELAQELMEMGMKARENRLSPKEMQGGCMTITSLGGFGGQHFTPIINQPEVAILGVSRSGVKLVKEQGEVQERLMLPLSLSYDHRAIDGVAAVKFITSLKRKLEDVWSLIV
jgi:pyruvate dehydrogenase E2 component (dihydrolipoamide acetyltransferase)